MKKFLALALVGLMAASANALTVSIVARSGPNAYTGGTPSLSNGSVGSNTTAGGLLPSAGGAGITVPVSGTATMGIVLELLGGTNVQSGADNPNQISTATIFFANEPQVGQTGVVDLAGINHTSVNRFGNEWRTAAYSTGMNQWINTRTGGVGGDLQGGTVPFVEAFHQINFDDIPAGGQGGNAFGAPNATFLLTEIIVHGVGPVGSEARIVFNTGSTEFFTEESEAYGFQNVNLSGTSQHGGDNATPGGFWYARNGRIKGNAFPIEVVIPEPASVAILGLGALALLRKRVR
jgi:hypothetical protein